MKFKEYPHIEKLGHIAVRDIEIGQVHVFPKIDGTNASMWIDDGEFAGGSRKRTLSADSDNAGFLNWCWTAEEASPYTRLLIDHSYLRLYGEWLVPHTFKAYRDEAWRKFYVFDIYDHEQHKFLHYGKIVELADEYKFTYIPALAIIEDPTKEQLMGLMNANTYLCKDGEGIIGEGIVLKRYGYVNKFGHTTWAKMVRAEFKDKHRTEMPVSVTRGSLSVERDAVMKYLTEAFVMKERAKIEQTIWNEYSKGQITFPENWALLREQYLASRECRKHLIPRLLQTIFYELVREHAWDFGGKPGSVVDFKKLRVMVIAKIKEFNTDLF